VPGGIMKKIYIVLTRTNTMLSKIIRFVKKDEYTHASLSLDKTFETMYSFGRKYTYNPFIGTFVTENFNDGIYGLHRYLYGKVLEINVDDSQYEKITALLNKFESDRNSYNYNYTGLLRSLFNVETHSEKNFLCSEFVYHLLNSADIADFGIHRSLVRPQDLLKLNGKTIYSGNLKNINTSLNHLKYLMRIGAA